MCRWLWLSSYLTRELLNTWARNSTLARVVEGRAGITMYINMNFEKMSKLARESTQRGDITISRPRLRDTRIFYAYLLLFGVFSFVVKPHFRSPSHFKFTHTNRPTTSACFGDMRVYLCPPRSLVSDAWWAMQPKVRVLLSLTSGKKKLLGALSRTFNLYSDPWGTSSSLHAQCRGSGHTHECESEALSGIGGRQVRSLHKTVCAVVAALHSGC